MIPRVIAVFIAVLLIGAAAVFYRHLRDWKKGVLFLWIARCAIVAVLALAFFQPILKLKTLVMDEGRVAVLIDASKSMQLYDPDALMKRCGSLEGALRSIEGKPMVDFFCFGDSLRPIANDVLGPRSIRFSDAHSFFPMKFDGYQTIILISDGNWSNSSVPAGVFEGKQCYYLALPALSPRPYLRSECIAFQSPVMQDSIFTAAVAMQGYTRNGQPFEIDIRQGGNTVVHRVVKTDTGYFNDTVSLRFPAKKPGRFLYAIELRHGPDTLQSLMYRIGTVVPRVLTATIRSSSPTLDERLLLLALGRDRSWKIDNSDGADRRADALFLLSWDDKTKNNFSMLKQSAVALFVGCMPCSSRSIVTPDTFALCAVQADDTVAQRIRQRLMPAPSEIVACSRRSRPPLMAQNILLSCIVRKQRPTVSSAGLAGWDTLPFLFSGMLNDRRVIVLAGRDLWRMSFLPYGVDQVSESESFGDDLLCLVKQRLYHGFNASFFVYPNSSETDEYDSCTFRMIAPSELAASPATSTGQSIIRFSIRQKDRMVIDTAISLSIAGMNPNGLTLRMKPLRAETYVYDAVLTSGKKRFVCSDTLRVRKNDLEFSIQGQNTLLLNQLALVLDDRNPKAVGEALSGTSNRLRRSMPLFFQINQSWWLLGIIIALFTVEWVIRKKMGLDD